MTALRDALVKAREYIEGLHGEKAAAKAVEARRIVSEIDAALADVPPGDATLREVLAEEERHLRSKIAPADQVTPAFWRALALAFGRRVAVPAPPLPDEVCERLRMAIFNALDSQEVTTQRVFDFVCDALPPPTIPPGWALVPVEITDDMNAAMIDAIQERQDLAASPAGRVGWRAALAAAPKPPVTP